MRLSLVICFLISAISPVFAASAPHYQLTHTFKLGGDGGWDYLAYDPAGKRLFISRATRVMVVDPEKGAVLAEIPNTPGVHGIALAQDLGKGFTSNGQESTVTVFDLKTLKETARIKVTGQGPDAILYDPASQRVFTFNGHSDNSTVIDATNDKVVGTIPLDGRPEFAAADGAGHVYVNIEDKSELSAIDARKMSVTATWSLAPCQEPSGLAMDAKDRRLFSGCDNKLMAVSDADQGKVIATLPIGEGVDACGFDPETQLAFSSNGHDGTLTVIHEDAPDTFSVVENAATQKFARTMALNRDDHDVYLVTADVKVTPAPAGATGAAARPKRDVLPGSFTLLVMHRQ
ncbi:MAG TPA: YncE family protein [Gammaproteobacteria bacterium]|nr:YncE family protein [Gammaproteobacteria bacterium]